jgi:selenocysteine-specific elongation factor
MRDRHYILATAGHVDHGKSALIKALTGTDPDRLPEEKARGLTIELGFACLELQDQQDRYRIGVVDVPGHEDFVKNMVAGVGSIDLALIVVAADDGWMPQTEEHLQILEYLGISRAVIALTKVDLMPESELAADEARERLQGTCFEDSPMVETSVVRGVGLDDLRDSILGVLRDSPQPADIDKPRLPVDRVFTMQGAGTIVTGTLTGGRFDVGQSIVVQAGGNVSRIRRIQSHNDEVETAVPGTRTALNLPDVEAGISVNRGDVISGKALGPATNTLDAALSVSQRLSLDGSSRIRPLKDETRVRFHYGSAAIPAKVHFISGGPLIPGNSALVQIRTESPVLVFAGDRFILRDWPERMTLAGGQVLDPAAERSRLRSSKRIDFLNPRANDGNDARAYLSTQLGRDGAVKEDTILLQSRFSASEIAHAEQALEKSGVLVRHPPWLIDKDGWRTAAKSAAAAVDGHHERHPQSSGIPLSKLRDQLSSLLADSALFALLLADLREVGFEQSQTVLRRAAHKAELPKYLESAAARIHDALTRQPLEPPSRKEIVTDAATAQVLQYLSETDQAISIGPELVMSIDGYQKAVDAVRVHIRNHGPATVSELRGAVGTTRRIMVPLLEHLDREGITIRSGEKRRLRDDG